MSSNYPNGFADGVSIRGVPVDIPHPGQVFYVNSTSVLPKNGVGSSNGNDGTYLRPFATLDYAIGRCTADRGDIIYLMPGHSETISAAASVDFDVAGITVIGLGHGSKQAKLTWSDAAGTVHVDADDTRFYNINFQAAIADVTAGINIDNNGCEFHNCLFDESGADLNWVVVMNVADGVDDLVVDNCMYIGNDASNDHFIEMAGTHENVRITNNTMIHETAQTAAVAIIESATQQINLLLEDNKFHSETAAAAASCVVLTNATNNGWAINNTISTVDTDATGANAIAAFDVTGLASVGNKFVAGTADTHGIETFTTVEDLT